VDGFDPRNLLIRIGQCERDCIGGSHNSLLFVFLLFLSSARLQCQLSQWLFASMKLAHFAHNHPNLHEALSARVSCVTSSSCHQSFDVKAGLLMTPAASIVLVDVVPSIVEALLRL